MSSSKDGGAKVHPENVVLTKENDKAKSGESIGNLGLIRYSTASDKLLMILGTICGLGLGAMLPLFSIFLGDLYNDFQADNTREETLAAGRKFGKLFGLLGLVSFVAGFGQVAFFTIAAERQTLRIRKEYLNAVIKQEIAWFDGEGAQGLTSRIAENCVLIREGLGEKLGMLFMNLSSGLVGVAIGFYYDWKLTLVIFGLAPFLGAGGYLMMKFMDEATNGKLKSYEKAGTIAQESFSMIRTVASFGLEKKMTQRYNDELLKAEKIGIKQARGQGFAMGLTFGMFFMTYGVTFWAASKFFLKDKENAAEEFWLDPPANPECYIGNTINKTMASMLFCITNDFDDTFEFKTKGDVCSCFACACGCLSGLNTVSCPNGGDVIVVFFSVVMGAFALGQVAPSLTALNNAKSAAASVYSVIERKPKIDANSENKKTLPDMKGDIQFEKVRFRYPSREIDVFQNLNLNIPAGKMTAFVGASGSGKSTLTQIIMRERDVNEGVVLVDGVNVKDLDLKWFRSQISVVSQTPVLFATSIKENIAHGSLTPVSDEEIFAAAKKADAYDFIKEQIDGFETFVGGGGGNMLSGGQRQRICIARALIRKPKLLILDESTSALDVISEGQVQKAIDKLLAESSFTTISIAHRLSTIRNAHNIVVLGENGAGIVEMGTHEELLAKSGHYAALHAASKQSSGGGTVELKDQGKNEGETEGDDDDDDDAKEVQDKGKQADPIQDAPAIIREGSKILSSFIESGVEDDKNKEKKKEKLYSVSFSRLFSYSKPEKLHYIPGLLAATINGCTMPLFSIFFGGISNVFFLPTSELVQAEANRYALYFVGLSFAIGTAYYLQFTHFGIIAERMTTRVRKALFEALMRQEIAFYDRKKNSVGALTTRLATDAAVVKAALSDRTSLAVMNTITLILGLGIAFSYSWQLSLALIGMLPVLIVAGALQFLAMAGVAGADTTGEASNVLSEAIAGIRTVKAFDLRERVVNLYDELLSGPSKAVIKKGITMGAGFGFSQGSMFAIYSVAWIYGAKLIADGNLIFQDLITAFFAIVMVGMSMGQNAALAPDAANASTAVSSVFKIIDRKSRINPFKEGGAIPSSTDDASFSPDLVFENVTFRYPSRPKVKVFEKFNLKIKDGTTALVGPSGSGKSSCIALCQRFYDVLEGKVTFGGVDVKTADISWLRRQFGLCPQEPRLFSGTIRENIEYGWPESMGPLPQEKLEEAAKLANCEFVEQFPDKYDTEVGLSGSKLSNGQCQRIKIAAALISRPKILLFDESTSALPENAQKIVQESIDRVIKETGCRAIIIAHRLSTIKNADQIAVIHEGCVVEQGTHHELLEKKGVYFKLFESQEQA